MRIGRRPYLGVQLRQRNRVVDDTHSLCLIERLRALFQRGPHERRTLIAYRRRSANAHDCCGANQGVDDRVDNRFDESWLSGRFADVRDRCPDFRRRMQFFGNHEQAGIARPPTQRPTTAVYRDGYGQYQRSGDGQHPPEKRRIEPEHASGPCDAEKGVRAMVAQRLAPRCFHVLARWRSPMNAPSGESRDDETRVKQHAYRREQHR